MKIRDEDGARFGQVRFAGVMREVCLDCTPAAREGDYVLVHVGFAISVLDRKEAEHAYRTLEELGLTSELQTEDEALG